MRRTPRRRRHLLRGVAIRALSEDENALDAQISLANARTMSGDALSTVAPAPFVAKLREALVN